VNFTLCGSGKASAAVVGFHCDVTVGLEVHDLTGAYLKGVKYFASNHPDLELLNILELPSSAVATTPDEMTLPDEEWQVQTETPDHLSAINPEGFHASTPPTALAVYGAPSEYLQVATGCFGPTRSLPLPPVGRIPLGGGQQPEAACRWDMSGQGRKGGGYKMQVTAQVVPIVVTLAPAVRKWEIVFIDPEDKNYLWSDPQAPRSQVRFELPFQRGGKFQVLAKPVGSTLSGPWAVATVCSGGQVGVEGNCEFIMGQPDVTHVAFAPPS
jgi:hypothetical protein